MEVKTGEREARVGEYSIEHTADGLLEATRAPRSPWTVVLAKHCAIALRTLSLEGSIALFAGALEGISDEITDVVTKTNNQMRCERVEELGQSWEEIREKWREKWEEWK